MILWAVLTPRPCQNSDYSVLRAIYYFILKVVACSSLTTFYDLKSYYEIAAKTFSTYAGFEPAILSQAIQFQVSKAGNSPLPIKLTLSVVVITHPV